MSALISDELRRLNADLHRADDRYGTGGKNHLKNIVALCDALGTRSVLDYGCGKGSLAQLIGFPISNYDPAIPSLAVLPAEADIVVCTDVLEHVEPERVDAVLAHIAGLARRAIYLSISQEPSIKSYADGRNAHLLQQRAEWWREKLDKLWHWRRVFAAPGGCFVYIGTAINDSTEISDAALDAIGPPPETKIVTPKSVFTPHQRCAQIRSSLLRGLPSVPILPAHDKLMVLACYGPSLKHTIGNLKEEVRYGGDLWTVSGAHQFCLDHGVVPKGHIEADPRPVAALRLGKPDPRVMYLCASASPRELFDKLAENEVFLFHVNSSEEETALIRRMRPFETVWLANGGTNVGMAALFLAGAFGYRRVAVHGMDCSHEAPQWLLDWPREQPFPQGEELEKALKLHAGPHPSPDTYIMRVHVGVRTFITTGQLAQGVQDFVQFIGGNPFGLAIRVHGDGMLRNVIDHIRSGKHVVQPSPSVCGVRPGPTSQHDGPDKLDYQARFKARIGHTTRPRAASN